MTLDNLTDKEKAVLTYLNETSTHKLKFKLNERAIAETFNLNDLQVNEMISRFKEAGLIQKKRGHYKWFGQAVLEFLSEIV